MDNNINTLDELNKGCCMGIVALEFVLEKTEEESFRSLLEKQIDDYQKLADKIGDLYHEYSDSELHKTNFMEKAMTWYGIQKDTVLDNSISKLADLLLNGTNMGIIEGRKLLNNKKMDKSVHKICSEYVNMQEKYMEKLKKFL